MKIATIIWARPQFVKAAVVSRAMREREGLVEVIVHTGQRFDHNMSQVFFDEMEIPQPEPLWRWPKRPTTRNRHQHLQRPNR